MKQRDNVQVIRVPSRCLYRSTRIDRTTSLFTTAQRYKNVHVTRCQSIQVESFSLSYLLTNIEIK